jgi:hypothetical protein
VAEAAAGLVAADLGVAEAAAGLVAADLEMVDLEVEPQASGQERSAHQGIHLDELVQTEWFHGHQEETIIMVITIIAGMGAIIIHGIEGIIGFGAIRITPGIIHQFILAAAFFSSLYSY